MENFGYYLFVLLMIIVGFFVVKKVASCLIRSIVTGIVLAILIAFYYLYCK